MIIQMNGRFGTTVRLDLLPRSVVLIPALRDEWESRDIHADQGVWRAGSGKALRVDSLTVLQETADALGLSGSTMWPLRPPSGSAPPSQTRTYRFFCYGWENSVDLSHSFSESVDLMDHEGKEWSMVMKGVSYVLDGFDPDYDPADELTVAEVMGS